MIFMSLFNTEIKTPVDESNVNSSMLEFLQSDDQIAVKIREICKNQSINEIAVNLERLWNLDSEDKEEDFLDFFVDNCDVIKSQNNRNASLTYPSSNLGLVELVDDLLDILAEIMSKSKAIFSVRDTEDDEILYADFSEMANDWEYQQEALAIAEDFAYADWEAFELSEV